MAARLGADRVFAFKINDKRVVAWTLRRAESGQSRVVVYFGRGRQKCADLEDGPMAVCGITRNRDAIALPMVPKPDAECADRQHSAEPAADRRGGDLTEHGIGEDRGDEQADRNAQWQVREQKRGLLALDVSQLLGGQLASGG